MSGEPSVLGGMYVHVPFCLRKCAYCDFYSITDQSLLPEFLVAIDREIALTAPLGFPCDTVYFGGGTPSLLSPESIRQLLTSIRRHHPLQEQAEITLEINPGTVDPDSLRSYRRAGINRLSIGVQSFQDGHLSFLGRIHTAGQADEAIRSARRAGFRNVSLDLIYGLPGQSEKDWEEDLRQAWTYAPEHLSCYMLSYETGTPMMEKRDQGAFTALVDEEVALLFRKTVAFLTSRGCEHYEVSNFARRSRYRSRHNLKYWDFSPYIGWGPAAHSHEKNRRRWNHRDLGSYLAALASGRLPMETEEVLNPGQRMMEAIYLGLRQRQGIDIVGFDRQFQVCFRERFADTIETLGKLDFLRVTEKNCYLTMEGMLLLDSIVDRFVDAVD